MKTNAARILDRLGVPYELRDYAVDPDDLSAESVARKVGMDAAQVYKTLVVRGDKRGIAFAIVAGDAELDNKALARLTGDSKLEPVALREVQPLTGYIRGGVTALGAKKDFPVWIDETFLTWPVVSVSAGVRGTQMLLAPSDYVRATKARIGAFSRPKKASI